MATITPMKKPGMIYVYQKNKAVRQSYLKGLVQLPPSYTLRNYEIVTLPDKKGDLK